MSKSVQEIFCWENLKKDWVFWTGVAAVLFLACVLFANAYWAVWPTVISIALVLYAVIHRAQQDIKQITANAQNKANGERTK